METLGKSIRSQLCRTYPFENTVGTNENYMVCQINRGINCRPRYVVYCIKIIEGACIDMNITYIEKTSRSIAEELNENFRQYDDKKQYSICQGPRWGQSESVQHLDFIKVLNS